MKTLPALPTYRLLQQLTRRQIVAASIITPLFSIRRLFLSHAVLHFAAITRRC